MIDYVPEAEIQLAMQKNQSPLIEKDKLATLKTQIKPNENITTTNIEINTNKTNGNTQDEEEPVKTLDSLFKKTQTKPHIYFLPLSEEEVQERRQKLNK
jgi:hypothetical protein